MQGALHDGRGVDSSGVGGTCCSVNDGEGSDVVDSVVSTGDGNSHSYDSGRWW